MELFQVLMFSEDPLSAGGHPNRHPRSSNFDIAERSTPTSSLNLSRLDEKSSDWADRVSASLDNATTGPEMLNDCLELKFTLELTHVRPEL